MPEFFEKPKPQKQPEKKDDSGDFANNPERKSWLEMMRQVRESFSGKKEMTRIIMAIMVLFGSGSFIDAMTSGRPGAKDAFYDNLTKQTREMSPEDLKQRMEAYFQIKLISPTQAPEITFLKDKKVLTAEWDNEKLMTLTRFLNELPPHFYYPIIRQTMKGEQKIPFLNLAKKVNFALIENVPYLKTEKGEEMGGWCSCSKAYMVHEVIISKDVTEERFKKLAVHELTHRITFGAESFYEQRLFNVLGVKNNEDLKKLLFNVPGQLRVFLEHGSLNAFEFISTAAEFYLDGESKFVEIYSYLGKSRAEKLYEFIKQDVFLGKEYYSSE